MIYLINETIVGKAIIGILCAGSLEFQLYEKGTNLLLNNESMDSQNSFHAVEFIDDIDGYILLQNPSSYSSVGRLFFTSVFSVVDLSSNDNETFTETIEFDVPILYKVTNLRSDEEWVHYPFRGKNEFQFLNLMCFSSSILLNSKTFDAISAEFEAFSTVYFVILTDLTPEFHRVMIPMLR